MNYNASNKTNFYNDKSQYTNKLKTMVYITLDQITPTALAGTRLHILDTYRMKIFLYSRIIETK